MTLMRKKRCFTGILSVFLFASSLLNASINVNAADFKAEAEARKSLPIESNQIENWPNGPAIGAGGAILMEANTGAILYAKNIHEHFYPASTTKVLTALIASEHADMNEMVRYSHEAVFSIERGSSNMGMDENEQITMEQSLYGLLVNSANEAANAIGEHIAGSISGFVEMMNQKAAELGCKDSHFVTTNGLHSTEHYTSAYDMALIAREFFKNELLCKMSSTCTYYIPQTATQPDDDLYLHSLNKLYEGRAYEYPGLVGSKTGYTSDARSALVSCAERDGMKLVCIILKEESPDQFIDTVNLFNYGFDSFQMLNVSENEKDYVIDNSNFFTSDNDVFGDSNPILSVNASDCVVIPKTAVFDDLESALSYDTNQVDSVAEITYTYHDTFVGSASVDLASAGEDAFQFDQESSSESESLQQAAQTETAPEQDENVIFINVKKTILWIVGIAVLIILLVFLKNFISNYQFSRRGNSRKRRKKRRRKYRRRNYYYDDDNRRRR